MSEESKFKIETLEDFVEAVNECIRFYKRLKEAEKRFLGLLKSMGLLRVQGARRGKIEDMLMDMLMERMINQLGLGESSSFELSEEEREKIRKAILEKMKKRNDTRER